MSYTYVTAGDRTRLQRVTTAGVSTEDFGYDAEGRASSTTLVLTNRPNYPMVTDYIYDTLDRVTDVRYPQQYGTSTPRRVVHTDYDAASRVSGLSVDGAAYASNIAYNAASQTTSLTVGASGQSSVESYEYDAQTGLLSRQQVQRAGQTLLDLSYNYVRAGTTAGRTGQLTRITNNRDATRNRDRWFEYDAVGRLRRATSGESGIWAQRYVYDRYGNRSNVSAVAGEDFIRNFYQSSIARQPIGSELSYWQASLQTGYLQGEATLLAYARDLGNGLFTSQEYINRQRSDRDYVADLYRAYLGREPDQAGWDGWTAVVASLGREYVRNGFAQGSEFIHRTGGVAPNARAGSIARLDAPEMPQLQLPTMELARNARPELPEELRNPEERERPMPDSPMSLFNSLGAHSAAGGVGGDAARRGGESSTLGPVAAVQSSETNLARDKPAQQSSDIPTPGMTADVAVNGSISDTTHTNYDNQAWWQVDLGDVYTINRIKLWNRPDCCQERLSNFYVFVSDVPFQSTSLSQTQQQAGVTGYYMAGTAGATHELNINRTARYVRVQLAGTHYLSLGEVEVWGSMPPEVNLARDKPAQQSSTVVGGVASRAVDGNTNGDWYAGSVTHTNGQNQPWWEVDLGSVQSLQTVRLWNRTDCCGERLSNFYVFVSDVPFTSTDPAVTQSQPGVSSYYTAGMAATTHTQAVNRTGRYVRVQLAGTNALSLAEVEVLGSPPPNVARGRAAQQSSDIPTPDMTADVAVNGSISDTTHTNYDNQAWWQVDLGNVYALETIKVWNRADCCPERLSNFYVFVSDVPFLSASLSQTQQQAGVTGYYTAGGAGPVLTLAVNRTGRYIRVQLAGENYLSLAEVEAFGRPSSSPSAVIPRDGYAALTYGEATNRITWPNFAYDASGNQTITPAANPSGQQRYQYDAANRLVRVTDGSGGVIANYTYGATNQRLITEQGGQRTYYVAASGSVLAEYTEATSSTTPAWSQSYIYLGGRLLATLELSGGSERVEYHHPDRLGTRLTTNQSDSSTQEQATLPFGTSLAFETSGTSTSRRFTSYDRSAVTGLDYAVNRSYDPLQGRFTQVDPAAMSAVSLDNPQTLNLYAYCANDPVNCIDPDGLGIISFFKKFWKVIVAVAVVVAIAVLTFGAGAVLGAVKAFGQAVWSGIKTVGKAIWSGIKAVGRSIYDAVSSAFTSGKTHDLINGDSFKPQEGAPPGEDVGGCGTITNPCDGGTVYTRERIPWHQRGILGAIGRWAEGFADEVTFGFTRWYDARRGIGRDEDSAAYRAGGWTGFAGSFIIPGGGARNALNVTRTGLSVTRHGVHQAITRGVRPQHILDATRNPLRTNPVRFDSLGRPSQRIIGRYAEVVINPATGGIVSVNPTSSARVRSLLRRR